MTYFIGVDPGKRGAFAVIDDTCKLHAAWRITDLPVMRKSLRPFKKKTTRVVIEQARVIAKGGQSQGTKSMFTYGVGYGKLLGMLDTLGFSYDEVHPITWQRRVLGRLPAGESKLYSKKMAMSWHPDFNFIPEGCYKVHDGITDAVCIAHFAQRLWEAEES